jgi:hypothetical protein
MASRATVTRIDFIRLMFAKWPNRLEVTEDILKNSLDICLLLGQDYDPEEAPVI